MTRKPFANIFDAAQDGSVEDVKYFIERADVNGKDQDGWTALDIAKGKGNVAVVEYLDGLRNSPFTAVEQAEIDAFCKMYGCDVRAVDHSGEPFLLHEAAAHWDVAVVKYLVSLGAGVNAIKEGFTPLMSAIADNPSIDVFKYLVFGGSTFAFGKRHQ